jgi:hypothetical protein
MEYMMKIEVIPTKPTLGTLRSRVKTLADRYDELYKYWWDRVPNLSVRQSDDLRIRIKAVGRAHASAVAELNKFKQANGR